jgi:hypothetical protein
MPRGDAHTSDLGQDILTTANAPALAAAFLDTVPTNSGAFSGRGIVICAGGVKYLTCAWVLVNILRQLGCEVPIEVWYLGEDEGDRNWIKLVEPLGVTCVDAHEVRLSHPHPRLGGWELKPYAILHSRFEEVLLLDADNVPAVDPTCLFDAPGYLEAGAVFWPDPPPPHVSASPAAWSVFDVPHREEPEQESGQILIDKRRGWLALNLCACATDRRPHDWGAGHGAGAYWLDGHDVGRGRGPLHQQLLQLPDLERALQIRRL